MVQLSQKAPYITVDHDENEDGRGDEILNHVFHLIKIKFPEFNGAALK